VCYTQDLRVPKGKTPEPPDQKKKPEKETCGEKDIFLYCIKIEAKREIKEIL